MATLETVIQSKLATLNPITELGLGYPNTLAKVATMEAVIQSKLATLNPIGCYKIWQP